MRRDETHFVKNSTDAGVSNKYTAARDGLAEFENGSDTFFKAFFVFNIAVVREMKRVGVTPSIDEFVKMLINLSDSEEKIYLNDATKTLIIRYIDAFFSLISCWIENNDSEQFDKKSIIASVFTGRLGIFCEIVLDGGFVVDGSRGRIYELKGATEVVSECEDLCREAVTLNSSG